MIDLHIHTKESDGTDDSHSLLAKLRNAGVTIFSVTDHDNMDESLYMEYCCPQDMTFIRGIEFSCVTEVRNCHIRGYGYNKDVRAWGRIIETVNNKKREVLKKHLEFIVSEHGIKLDEEQQNALECCCTSGDWKSRLAGILVSMGKAADEQSAIATYISPCNTNHIRPDVREAIAAILAAGGIPVWAHPYGGYGKRDMDEATFNRQLRILMDAGLQGLECYYSGFDEAQVTALVETAKKNNLFISGGSDYHGDNKTIELGTLNSYGKEVTEEDLTIIAELKKRQQENPYPLIEIEEWHNPGACFWFGPIKVNDLSVNTWNLDNMDYMQTEEISVSEWSFRDFLYPLFKKHFDKELPENKSRYEELPEGTRYITWFEWYLTENFYTYNSIEAVLADIEEVAAILENDYDDARLDFIRKGLRNLYVYLPEYWHAEEKLTDEEADRVARENQKHILDFYRRFVEHIRAMMVVGEAAGYKLISVCGP